MSSSAMFSSAMFLLAMHVVAISPCLRRMLSLDLCATRLSFVGKLWKASETGRHNVIFEWEKTALSKRKQFL
jgi:hypothetical protein